MSIEPVVLVTFTDRFQKDVRRLSKRYRRIRLDLQPIITRLEAGEILGDRIPQMDRPVFKVRVKNSDVQKGKSGGYRVIYYLKTSDRILLVTMYSKSDVSDISAAEVAEVLAEAEAELNDSEEEEI
jgi:mRNA-degrading endonuclease RelE of RelBE toxin-antitoxin system